MEKATEILSKRNTAHIKINPRTCVACWKCVDACPKQVIGKIEFLWHKHIVIKNPKDCSGCMKCIKTCPHGVFSQT